MENLQMDFPTPFESKRLILRSFRPGDGDWYYAVSLRNREHLRRFEAENVAANISSPEEAERLVGELELEWNSRRCFFIGAFEKISGDFAVQVYVGPIDWHLAEFEIGYFADVDHEGHGFVTEAVRATLVVLFERMNAHRVHLNCDEANLRSIRVAERCGMTREGYLRENRRNPDGTYSGSYIYSLLISEFQAHQGHIK